MRNMLLSRFHTLLLMVEDWYIQQICAPFLKWSEKWSLSYEVWPSYFHFFHILIPISSLDKPVLGFTSQAARPQISSLPGQFQLLLTHFSVSPFPLMLNNLHMHQALPACTFANQSVHFLHNENGTIVFSLLPGPCATTDFFSAKT